MMPREEHKGVLFASFQPESSNARTTLTITILLLLYVGVCFAEWATALIQKNMK